MSSQEQKQLFENITYHISNISDFINIRMYAIAYVGLLLAHIIGYNFEQTNILLT